MSGTASVVQLTTEAHARAEARARDASAAWARFSSARNRAEFCSSWLAVLCTQIDHAKAGLLIMGPEADGSFVPVAMWPDPTRDLQHLSDVVQRTLGERRGILVGADGSTPPGRDQPARVGYPIEVSGVLHGTVVLELGPAGESALQQTLRLLHWSSVWLVDQIRQRALAEQQARVADLAMAMEMVATAVQERRLQPSAIAVVNELAARLKCDRVSIGYEKSRSVTVEAISNTAIFDAKMALVRQVGTAMEETLDLDAALVWPPRDDDELGAVAHADLAREQADIAVCSVPLIEGGVSYGVILFERAAGAPFDAQTLELCKTAGRLLGPILALKRDNEQGMLRWLGDKVQDAAQVLFGPRHPGVKLIALVVIGILGFLIVTPGTHRVAARAFVEGAVQRAAVAPFDGHIAQGNVRAGDLVQAGQVLAALDDRDLRLELARVRSEREQAGRKHRQALATLDRATMLILAAQIAENDAQIALLNDRLSRATLTAPFAGVVVSGDLSQLLGTPVEQGRLLFQIAPLDAYRVILEVDERDIAYLSEIQGGELRLSGLPDETMPFTVSQITPVSSQQDGRNFFRVEARLDTPLDRIRPGMEGVGKITVGERKLLWIWTHSFVDWLRTWAWKELP